MSDQPTSANVPTPVPAPGANNPPPAGPSGQFPKRTLAILVIYQAILILMLAYLIITIWPMHNQVAEGHWTYFYLFGRWKVWLTDDMQLLFLVMAVGAFGSLIQEAMALTTRVANHTMEPSWITWYYMRPLIGTAIATVLYLAFRGGLFNPNPTAVKVNIYATAALAGLAGWFSGQAAKKMEQVFDTFFNVQPKAATPTITQLQPPSVNVGTTTPVPLTITGTNFVPGSVARMDGVAQPTTYVNSSQLTTTLPPEKMAQAGTVHVTVFNPSSGESSPAMLPVKAT